MRARSRIERIRPKERENDPRYSIELKGNRDSKRDHSMILHDYCQKVKLKYHLWEWMLFKAFGIKKP